MKEFKGKAIYNPSGKAGEYSYWACNFYVGCSNGCNYCYLKKGRGAKVLGGNEPKLKACFKDENHAMKIFEKELLENLEDLQKHGLFFSFTTDPMLKETIYLTIKATIICLSANVPVKILTKCAEPYTINYLIDIPKRLRHLLAIGCTLTGADYKEPNASNNIDRIELLRICKSKGFKTFASIEPIISFEKAKAMILDSLYCVDLYKVGLESGKKYDKNEAKRFFSWLVGLRQPKIYVKESFRKLTYFTDGWSDRYFVDRDYNIFN